MFEIITEFFNKPKEQVQKSFSNKNNDKLANEIEIICIAMKELNENNEYKNFNMWEETLKRLNY